MLSLLRAETEIAPRRIAQRETTALVAAGDHGDLVADAAGGLGIDPGVLSAFGRTLTNDADAAAARATLGLGSAALSASGDFQPSDADLAAIAALTTTAFGRSFLTLANAAAARALLELGSAAQAATGDFQPADAQLSALALLAYVGNAGEVLRINATEDGFETAPPAAGSASAFTTVEIDLGAVPRRSGSFTIAGAGMTPGKPVMIQQAAGPYTGKGTLADEAEMDLLQVTASVTSATVITAYFTSPLLVAGNFKFDYLIGA